MNTPAYPNLMDINLAVKGTMQECLKELKRSEPKTEVRNTPLYKIEKRNQNLAPLTSISTVNTSQTWQSTRSGSAKKYPPLVNFAAR